MQPSQSTAKSMNVMYAWASARMRREFVNVFAILGDLEMQEEGAVLGLC